MFRINWIGAFVVCTLMHASPSASQAVVLNCQIVQVEDMPDEWRQVDRVEFDEARNTITFAISRTLGTANEKAWTFTNRKDAISRDQVAFERVGDTLRIVALRLSSPAAIWVEPTSVRFVGLKKFGIETASFACRQAG